MTASGTSTQEQAGLVTRRSLAVALGVHPQTVTKWEREGLPIAERGRKGRPSLYCESDVRAWLAQREAAAKDLESLDLVAERARKEHWQAQLAEQQFQVRAGRLIPVDDVERTWSHQVAAVRAKFLAMPTALSDRLHRAATLEGVAAVEATLQAAIYDALRELSGAEPTPPAKKRRRAPKARRRRAK